MTDIATGNLAISGTRTFIVGTSTGLDTATLVENAVLLKTRQADLIDVQISENSAKVSAYDEIKTLAQNLQTSLDALKSPESIFADDNTAFAQKNGFITTSDGSDVSGIVAVSLDSTAAESSYDIEVLQTAETQKVIGTSVADKTADLGYAGSFTLGLTGGATETISVTADFSLEEIAAAINAVSDTTNIEASVLKVSETEFQLVLNGTQTAVDIEVTGVTGDDVLNLVGITDGVGGFQNELQASQGAIIEIDGVQITRNDNVFDDVIDGVELNLRNASPGTIITLEVEPDAQAVKDAILDFISSYNAIRDFVIQNQQVSDTGEVSDDAVLFSDLILDTFSAELTDLIGTDFSDASTKATIRDLGLAFGANNKLEIVDESALDAALLNDFEDVQDFFASRSTSDNTEFTLISNTSTDASQDIAFNITVDGSGNITSVTANGDNSAFTISGQSLIGAEGTAYEGLVFSYQGTTSVTVNTSVYQGLADRLFNTIENYSSDIDGLFQQEKIALETTNEDLSQEATEIRERAEAFRIREIEKYARMEARIEQLKLIQNQIRAILNIDQSDN